MPWKRGGARRRRPRPTRGIVARCTWPRRGLSRQVPSGRWTGRRRGLELLLVEELAGLMWRDQGLVMAETAAYRAGLHRALGEGARDEDRVLVRALAHLDGGEPTETAAAVYMGASATGIVLSTT